MTSPRLPLRRAFALALPVLIAAAGAALAQSPWPAGPPAASSAPGPSPFDAPPAGVAPGSGFAQPAQQEPPCLKAFVPLRDDANKKMQAIHAANERKASAQEACGLFNAFVAAETKAFKFAQANASSCGIPPQAIVEMKKGHEQAIGVRNRVCKAAKLQQQAPPGPSLSDALGASRVPDASNVKPGRGTFDTLTGTPLGKQ